MPSKPPPPPLKNAATPSSAVASPKFERIAAGPATSRVVLNCAEGWGKTTAMAHALNPLLIIAPQERGIVTLRRAERVPDVPVARPETWTELLELVRSKEARDFKTVCFDALGGIEQMCREHVLKRDFGGDESKYQAFGRGNATLGNEWMVLLAALEPLTDHASVILASHVAVGNFNNPNGDNYGVFVADCSKQVWAATKRWADGVFFGTFFTTVDEGKGKGGTQRVLHTEHRATHDAKNRWGMPAMIQIPNEPEKVYETIFSHINGKVS